MPKHLHDGDSWILAEEIPDIDFQFSQIWLSSFVNDLETTIGINYSKVLCVYDRGYNLTFYYGTRDSELVSSAILRKILDEDFASKINKNIRRVADTLEAAILRVTPEYLKGLSDADLSAFYKELDTIHTEFYAWCWLPNAVDMFHAHFTDYLKDLLVKKSGSDTEANAALVALSFSDEKSFVQEETESLLKLASLKKKRPEDSAAFERALAEHHARYFYLKHLWVGKDGVATLDEYRHDVDRLLSEGDPDAKLAEEERKRRETAEARDEYEARLGLTPQERALFRSYAEFAFTKAYRRRIQLFWAYQMDFVFEELSKRLGITFMESRFLLPNEVDQGLQGGLSEEMKKVAKMRTEHCVYYAEKGLEIVAVGDACREFEVTIKSEAGTEGTECKGQVAYVGKVTGTVKIVNSVSDIHKVEEGDILVSIATNPDVLPAMKKAAAFVTEQGGITSHAAIVSREMQKPCIVGTKVATKMFKDGDMVEVDAEKGIVRKI